MEKNVWRGIFGHFGEKKFLYFVVGREIDFVDGRLHNLERKLSLRNLAALYAKEKWKFQRFFEAKAACKGCRS